MQCVYLISWTTILSNPSAFMLDQSICAVNRGVNCIDRTINGLGNSNGSIFGIPISGYSGKQTDAHHKHSQIFQSACQTTTNHEFIQLTPRMLNQMCKSISEAFVVAHIAFLNRIGCKIKRSRKINRIKKFPINMWMVKRISLTKCQTIRRNKEMWNWCEEYTNSKMTYHRI